MVIGYAKRTASRKTEQSKLRWKGRREGASPRKSVVQSSCQYDVMSRFGDFSKWRAKSLLMRRIK